VSQIGLQRRGISAELVCADPEVVVVPSTTATPRQTFEEARAVEKDSRREGGGGSLNKTHVLKSANAQVPPPPSM